MNLCTAKEIAEVWGITSRRVTILCKEGRVEGAMLKGHTWLIPEGTPKPMELKRGKKAAKGD